VGGATLAALQPLNATVGSVVIDGVAVTCGEVQTQEPEFDAAAPGDAHRVLLRVLAFSCSGADRARVLDAARRFGDGRFFVIGSEFAAEVVRTGAAVSTVRAGDRVIGDNAWPGVSGAAWRGGIPTPHASREYLVLHEQKVMRIPAGMDAAEAAGFSIAAQTAYAMVDRSGAKAGSHVLVNSARSPISLFAMDLLRRTGAHVYATTTARDSGDWLRERGADAVFAPASGDLHETARELDGFDCVLDPFFHLHLPAAVDLLAIGGRYVASGGDPRADAGATLPGFGEALHVALVKNLHLRGSMLGTREHLARALDDRARGDLRVPPDSVWGGGDAAGFLRRTFADPGRRGRAVYRY